MRDLILLRLIFPMLLIFILSSCSDDEKSFLDLDKKSIELGVDGEGEVVKVTTNGYWEIQNIPQWIHVEPSSGEYSAELTITASKNEEETRREASLTFVGSGVSRLLEIEQLCIMDLDPFLELSTNSVKTPTYGGEEKVQITTNREWKIEWLPDWISISPMSGSGTTQITVRVGENREPQGRGASVVVSCTEINKYLDIDQYGLKEVIRTPSLPIFTFEKMTFTTAMDNFEVEATTLFVNPGIKEKVYLGNLLSYNAQPHTDIPQFTRYTFNPVTVTTSAPVGGEIVKTYIPSWQEQDTFAQDIIGRNPMQNQYFTSDDGSVEFYDHKRLYTIGMINLGVKLDEVVSGSSYTEKEMTKKFGLIFSFRQNLFDLIMDYPQRLVQEDITEADLSKGVSYVHSVNYGRVGLLVVETDVYSSYVRTAIKKVIAGEVLSALETDYVRSSDISYVYFNNDLEVQVERGHLDVINRYREDVKEKKDNIYPVMFTLSDYQDHSLSTMTFSFKVPE